MAKNLAPWWVPAGAPDLQKAKREAAERFYAIGMSYVPEGYKVTFHKSLSGWANSTEIKAPKPVTRKSLYIFLHECAHAQLHWHGKRKPRHVEELEAEQWAHAKMREHGIAVPKVMTARAKAYVGKKIRQALRSGAKPDNISKAAVRFANRRK